MDIKELWNSKDEKMWEKALEEYYSLIKSNNIVVEKRLNNMSTDDFKKMSGTDFYRFLLEDYVKWKYTDGRYRAGVINLLKTYEKCDNRCIEAQFKAILNGLFYIDIDDVSLHMLNLTRIKGIGVAGASGILSIILPQYFGTVDKYVVENLRDAIEDGDRYKVRLTQMNLDDLNVSDAAVLIRIFREKAEELNKAFSTDKWTPRKIDMALWSIREKG